MTIITLLHRNVLHQAAHDEPYLKRYHSIELTLLDHYRQLYQLLPIYEVLEEKLKAKNFTYQLPEKHRHLLARSDEIRNDLMFLRPRVLSQGGECVLTLESTHLYLKAIEAMTSDHDIFIHFLVRVLGDMFGGNGLKKCMTDLCQAQHLAAEKAVNFYTFKEGALKEFSQWLNEFAFEKETVDAPAKTAFQYNIDILKALETTRKTFVNVTPDLSWMDDSASALPTLGSITKNMNTFFKAHKKEIVCGSVLLLGTAAFTLNQYYKSMSK